MDNGKLFDAITTRKSIRDYSSRNISKNLLNKIKDFTANIPVISDTTVNFIFHENREKVRDSVLLPIANFIADAPVFVTVSGKADNGFLVESGYRMEYLILYLTSLGLGTCYIGGFIDFKKLRKKLKLNKKEEIVILSPVGYPDTSFMGFLTNSFIEAGKIMIAGSSRKEIEEIVFYEKWENPYVMDETLKNIFEYTRLAPSGANLQSWRFLIKDAKIYAFAYSTLPAKLIGNEKLWNKDYRKFDVGIALAHFDVAAKHFGYKGHWQLLTDNGIPDFSGACIPADASPVAVWQ